MVWCWRDYSKHECTLQEMVCKVVVQSLAACFPIWFSDLPVWLCEPLQDDQLSSCKRVKYPFKRFGLGLCWVDVHPKYSCSVGGLPKLAQCKKKGFHSNSPSRLMPAMGSIQYTHRIFYFVSCDNWSCFESIWSVCYHVPLGHPPLWCE